MIAVGQTLAGKWHIDAELGKGGTSTVYAATHRNGLRVAIKVLHRDLTRDKEMRTRFLREGYVANTLQHPGIVRVLDDDVLEDGTAFVVMDLLEGESLAARAERRGGRLPPEDVLPAVDRLLDTLAVAHEARIVHRDIKPDNVFLTTSNEVKVLDFGLARLREAMGRYALEATSSGMVLGTLDYMSPEQARGDNDKIDGRADLWSVGATVFRLLSGRRVHSGKPVNEYLLATATEDPRSLAVVAPELPASLVAVVDRALKLDKNVRWPDARAMRAALREAHPATMGRLPRAFDP